jgi:hypothetical protein
MFDFTQELGVDTDVREKRKRERRTVDNDTHHATSYA